MTTTTAEGFFSKTDKEQIVSMIKHAELNTSGEIRVHLEKYCKQDVLDRAAYVFEQLKMHKTAERNGVLFYFAILDKKFAILGDAGINSKVPEDFWNKCKEIMLEKFKEGNFSQGLCEAIDLAGHQLNKYFPRKADDKNELSDDISFGKN